MQIQSRQILCLTYKMTSTYNKGLREHTVSYFTWTLFMKYLS